MTAAPRAMVEARSKEFQLCLFVDCWNPGPAFPGTLAGGWISRVAGTLECNAGTTVT